MGTITAVPLRHGLILITAQPRGVLIVDRDEARALVDRLEILLGAPDDTTEFGQGYQAGFADGAAS